jgi:hypothetical protein
VKELILPRLLPNEQKSLEDDVKIGCIHINKAVQAVFENLTFIHEGMTHQYKKLLPGKAKVSSANSWQYISADFLPVTCLMR